MNAVGKREPVEERRSLVVDAVLIGVFENLDATAVFATRIIPHLDHPQSPTFVPIECNRIMDQRFRRRQHHPQIRLRGHALERFLGALRSREVALQGFGIKLMRHDFLHGIAEHIFGFWRQARRSAIVEH